MYPPPIASLIFFSLQLISPDIPNPVPSGSVPKYPPSLPSLYALQPSTEASPKAPLNGSLAPAAMIGEVRARKAKASGTFFNMAFLLQHECTSVIDGAP